MQKKFLAGAVLGIAMGSAVLVAGIYLFEASSPQSLQSVAGHQTERHMSGTMDMLPDSSPEAPSFAGNPRATAVSKLAVPQETIDIPKRAEITLWKNDGRATKSEVDGLPAMRLQIDPSVLDEFHVGQQLSLAIPQTGAMLESKITSTHNQLGGVKVWNATIKNGYPEDNIIVTQGQIETHLIVSTSTGTYTAVIDNSTGNTTIMDEGDIAARTIPYEDGIRVEPVDDSPPIS